MQHLLWFMTLSGADLHILGRAGCRPSSTEGVRAVCAPASGGVEVVTVIGRWSAGGKAGGRRRAAGGPAAAARTPGRWTGGGLLAEGGAGDWRPKQP